MADINGTDNDDILVGGADDDSIYAYGGTDTVTGGGGGGGGGGNDTFELRGWENNKFGTITDFTAGDGPTDKIDLDGLGPGWHWVKANSPGISMN
ncbi:MAG: hypothetical protein OSB76_00595 [Alphaproteobacteria bacterium]|nr:hypothetical protein [Alphaproteobacteria bacterium]